MDKFVKYNANPVQSCVGDCVIRAICTALGEEWERTFVGVCVCGLMLADMPSANHVWGTYLRGKGFRRHYIESEEIYRVRDFCEEHPRGTYILAIDKHVVAVKDGHYYDTWDSGDEIPIYYWEKE